jgi:hypothetical protein
MEMEELKNLFRLNGGWTVHMRKRNQGTQYVYASRKRKRARKVEEVYFAPLSKVENMTEEQVLEKLASITK